ncbi:MAG: hypothetical protein ACRDZ6_06685 [Acidimicrobiales bacterium]
MRAPKRDVVQPSEVTCITPARHAVFASRATLLLTLASVTERPIWNAAVVDSGSREGEQIDGSFPLVVDHVIFDPPRMSTPIVRELREHSVRSSWRSLQARAGIADYADTRVGGAPSQTTDCAERPVRYGSRHPSRHERLPLQVLGAPV